MTLSPKTRKAGIQVFAKDAKGVDVEAKVEVDGKTLGDAPGTFTVPMCSKRVEVSHQKHGTWTSELKLREKKTTTLTAKLGSGAKTLIRSLGKCRSRPRRPNHRGALQTSRS